ncbi:PREDICTED: proline iminopeptidase [Prunus dulcis]|uniref:PREDICTED: proline iminopeptidase n=1 Tax=Prunus dulcis TaxID=3755 RepID=A0A5E4GLZ3_PRUDU|nr:PREDICTED: proline iminopeptidase [Prunus dulcis]
MLHLRFERVWDPIIVPGAPKEISYFLLDAFDKWSSFDTNPLYALLHESIYCQRLRNMGFDTGRTMPAPDTGPNCSFHAFFSEYTKMLVFSFSMLRQLITFLRAYLYCREEEELDVSSLGNVIISILDVYMMHFQSINCQKF